MILIVIHCMKFISDPPYRLQVDIGDSRTSANDSYHIVAVKDIINCSADGYPLPDIHWTLESRNFTKLLDNNSMENENPSYNQTGPGWGLLSFSMPGIELWTCTAINNYNLNTGLSNSFNFKG